MRPTPPPTTPVEQGNLQTHVQQLTAHGPRFQDAPGVAAAMTYLRKCVAGYGYVVQEEPYGSKPYEVNICCELTGSGTPVLEVGAHWDTVEQSPGADDNASGVAGVLEIARVLKADQQAGHGLGHTVRFCFFGGEEDYELGTGSRYHVSRQDPRPDGAIVLEMIACRSTAAESQEFRPDLARFVKGPAPTTGDFIAAIAVENAKDYVTALSSATATHGVPILPVLLPAGPDYSTYGVSRSDHRYYWARSIKAVMVTDTAELRNKAYHTKDDTPEKLDFAFAAQVTAAVADAVRALAA
jgi:aminopeptidase YwaD